MRLGSAGALISRQRAWPYCPCVSILGSSVPMVDDASVANASWPSFSSRLSASCPSKTRAASERPSVSPAPALPSTPLLPVEVSTRLSCQLLARPLMMKRG